MKRHIILGLSLVVFIFSAAFTNSSISKTSSTVYKLMEVTYLWDLLSENYEADRDRDDTWLDVGLRSKYAKAKQYASLQMVEDVFGSNVFVEGPHNQDLNFNSNTSFGHYNPNFIKQVQTSLNDILANPLYRPVLQRVFDSHFRSMANTYNASYIYLKENPDLANSLKKDYVGKLSKRGGITDGSLQESFRDYAEALEKNDGADVYEAFTAPSFWLRRSIDGTDAQIHELLSTVMGAFTAKEGCGH